jgi:hypothetical protein
VRLGKIYHKVSEANVDRQQQLTALALQLHRWTPF